MGSGPLISCVMPTYNRREFIPAAIDCFLKQRYQKKELVILDDGTDPIDDLVPIDDRIRYYHDGEKRLTGTKRNLVCDLARGSIIAHFDDDDYSAPDRLQDQVDRLLSSGAAITGYGDVIFWDLIEKCAKIYRSDAGYVLGTTLMFHRVYWCDHPFKDRQKATDNDFVYDALNKIAQSRDETKMIARIHKCHHTSAKSGIAQLYPKEKIPAGFWENEKLRLGE